MPLCTFWPSLACSFIYAHSEVRCPRHWPAQTISGFHIWRNHHSSPRADCSGQLVPVGWAESCLRNGFARAAAVRPRVPGWVATNARMMAMRKLCICVMKKGLPARYCQCARTYIAAIARDRSASIIIATESLVEITHLAVAASVRLHQSWARVRNQASSLRVRLD
jgi:hypothetical protein